MGQDSPLHLGEGRSDLAIVLLSERCGQVLAEPAQMLADDPADLLVWRSTTRCNTSARRSRRCDGPGGLDGIAVAERGSQG